MLGLLPPQGCFLVDNTFDLGMLAIANLKEDLDPLHLGIIYSNMDIDIREPAGARNVQKSWHVQQLG